MSSVLTVISYNLNMNCQALIVLILCAHDFRHNMSSAFEMQELNVRPLASTDSYLSINDNDNDEAMI